MPETENPQQVHKRGRTNLMLYGGGSSGGGCGNGGGGEGGGGVTGGKPAMG